jgi:hypothetical protein
LTIAPNGYVEFVLVPSIVARLQQVAPGIRLCLTPYDNDQVETGIDSGMTALVLGFARGDRLLTSVRGLLCAPITAA